MGYCASSALAEQICTPGETKSGLIRPSDVGPIDEKVGTCPAAAVPGRPLVDAPIVRIFFAVEGGLIVPDPEPPSFPAAKRTRKSPY